MLKNMAASEIKRMTTDGKTAIQKKIVKKIIYGVKTRLDLNWQFGSYDNFCDSRMAITSILASFNFLNFFARISYRSIKSLGIPTAIDDEQSSEGGFHF